MRKVPWWGVVSSAAAPVLMIGGWTVAAALQPGSFDQVTGTISALAGYGATDRWVMTLGLAGVGGGSVRHTIAAAVGFITLSFWPVLSAKREPSVPWPLRLRTGAGATVVLFALLVWFGAELRGGGQVGLAERVLAGAESLWPLVVVLACYRAPRAPSA